MKKKIFENINYILIYFVIIMLPITVLLKFYDRFFPILKVLSFNFFYNILWLSIPIQIIIYIYNLKKRKFKLDIFDIVLYILIILTMISVNLSIDFDTAVWGAYLRNEGFLSILSYYLLFLNSKDIIKEQIKKILDLIILVGLIQFVFCLLQIFVRGPYFLEFSHMASGFMGNPNFLGSFVTLVLSLTTGMYLIYKEKKYFIFSIIFSINLILAQSTGPFFAYLFTLLFMCIVLHKKKKIKNSTSFIATILITLLSTSFITDITFKNIYKDNIGSNATIMGDMISTLNLISPIKFKDVVLEGENLAEGYGSGRFTIWKNSFKIFPEYSLFGTGLDNFGYAYSRIVKPIGYYCDKAHNEYIQILITEGIFVFITYMTLLGLTFFKSIHSRNDLTLILLFGFIGYSVQAFMNISVTTVAPFYFIVMGLLVSTLDKKTYEIKKIFKK